jgi:hypothetical protein
MFRVDRITNERVGTGGRREFLVRWADYGPSDDSWEPKGNIDTDCPQAVQEWKLEKEERRKKKLEKAGRRKKEEAEAVPVVRVSRLLPSIFHTALRNIRRCT